MSLSSFNHSLQSGTWRITAHSGSNSLSEADSQWARALDHGRHEAIPADSQVEPLTALIEQVEIEFAIRLVSVDVGAPDATLSDMVRNSRQDDASYSRHVILLVAIGGRRVVTKARGRISVAQFG